MFYMLFCVQFIIIDFQWVKYYKQKQQSIAMPKFTIIEQPLAGQTTQKQARIRDLDQPYYLDKLRQVLQNSRRKNQLTTNQYKNGIVRHRSQRNQIPQRYETQKSQNQQQIVYVIKDDQLEQRDRIRLPKLKRKHRVIKYSDIDKNQKLIIRNYMNAKLIEFKKPRKKSTRKNQKINSTIDQVGQLPDKNSKRYYVYRKTTPIDELQSSSNGNSKYRQSFISSKTQKFQKYGQSNRRNNMIYPSAQTVIIEERTPSEKMILSKIIRTQGDEYPVIYKTNDKSRSKINQFADSQYKQYPSQYRINNKTQEEGWEFVDPLNLETYFIKLKKATNNSPQHSTLEKPRIKIPKIPVRQQMSKFIKNYKPQYDDIKIDDLIKKDSFQIIQDQVDGNQYFYFGETKDDTKNGLGVLITDKASFEGLWQSDTKVKGIETSQVGKYKGDFKDGKRSGKGQFFWSHGQYYSGEWKNGKKHGSGYWRSQKGENYMGQWKEGQVTGYGVHTMKTGQKYQGEFINFLKHGFGRQVFPNGDIYQGRYIQGQPHGKGKYEWKNGIIYEGQFVQGYRQGKGIIIAPNRLQFQGILKHDMISGMGKLKMSNGDMYNGMFENNKKNGHGILDLKSQRRIIKGIWSNNQLVRHQY